MAERRWEVAGLDLERFLAEASAVAALTFDEAQQVEWANPALQRMLGARVALEGRPLLSLVAQESHEAAGRLLAGGAPAERLQFLGGDGEVVLLTCRVHRGEGRHLLLGEAYSPTDSEVLRSMSRLQLEVANLGRDLQRRNRALEQALEEVRRLEGLLPICSYCKRIRTEAGEWQALETYLSQRTELTFNHGICGACVEKHFPGAGSGPRG